MSYSVLFINVMTQATCYTYFFKWTTEKNNNRCIFRKAVNDCPCLILRNRAVFKLLAPSSKNCTHCHEWTYIHAMNLAVPFHYITCVYVLSFSTLRMAVQHLQGWTGEYLCLICWNQKQVSSSFCINYKWDTFNKKSTMSHLWLYLNVYSEFRNIEPCKNIHIP